MEFIVMMPSLLSNGHGRGGSFLHCKSGWSRNWPLNFI